MSSLNVHLSRSAGRIATDTAGYDDEGRILAYSPKCLALPHVRCAVASRGYFTLLWNLAAALATGPARDFDALRPALRDRLGSAFAATIEAEGQAVATDGVIIGWSERERRVIGVAFAVIDGRVELVDVPDGLHCAPSDFGEFEPPAFRKLDVPATFVDLAKRQRRYFEKYEPHHRIGGDLVLTSVSRHGVEQRVVHSWPDEIGAEARQLAPASAAVLQPTGAP